MLKCFQSTPHQAHELELRRFLEWVEGPALFHLRGKDSNRVRVLMGGLHGNEPSGFVAVHHLLRTEPELPTDVVLVLGNVQAALYGAGFSVRMTPDGEDMNRVWGRNPTTALRRSAWQIHDYLRNLPIEAVADLHNNSGFNPIYAVLLQTSPTRIALARNWTRRYVFYEGVQLGTFLEQMDLIAPGVVIECGQAGDPEADERACAGALAFLTADEPWFAEAEGEDNVFRSVARVTIPDGMKIAFSMEPDGADITVSPGIDRHNFEYLMAGTLLAYRSEHGRLLVTSTLGEDVTDEWLIHHHGKIHLKRPIVPVMMTTDPAAAKSDCLLYLAERIDP